MISNYASLPALVIPNGASVSNILNGSGAYNDAIAIILYATDSAYAETYTLEVNQDKAATASSTGWCTLQGGNPNADLSPPAAGKSRVYQEIVFGGSFRIKASGNVGAARTWKADKIWTS